MTDTQGSVRRRWAAFWPSCGPWVWDSPVATACLLSEQESVEDEGAVCRSWTCPSGAWVPPALNAEDDKVLGRTEP